MKRVLKKLIPIALLLFSSIPVVAQTTNRAALRLRDINGRPISVARYQGRVLLINFWATWCIPCRSEIPELINLQSRYRRRGLRIIGITYPPERMSDVRRFVRKLKINYPVALGTKGTKALFTTSETLPMTVVIDRTGTVRDVIEGIMYSDEFDKTVRPLLFSEPK